MEIEVGKFYRTRDDRKVGPMEYWFNDVSCEHECDCLHSEAHDGLWKPDGSPYFSSATDSPDLVSEWVDEPSPTRIITRREIVPGTYGDVTIEGIPFAGRQVKYDRLTNAPSLRAAAKLFNELADVLDENAGAL